MSTTVAAGALTAAITIPNCSSVTLTLRQGSKTLATGSGASGLTLVATPAAGTLTATVTARRCRSTFTVTLTPVPPQVSVLSFGAVGDGVTDDTAALERALAALKPGDTLLVPAGKTFVHTGVLRATVDDTRITGGGVLLATNEESSAFALAADRVTVDNLTLRIAATTRRWDTPDQMKLVVGGTGAKVSNVLIDGSAAAGVFVYGATGFTLTDVTVQDSNADGIHITNASNNGSVVRPVIRNPGDDGIGIVSYKFDPGLSHHITVASPRLEGQKWGRGFAVVGGSDVLVTDVYADGSFAAGIYVAAESEWNTRGSSRVVFDGGTLVKSNSGLTIDHGAVLVYSSQAADTPNQDITVKNLSVVSTRSTASRQLGVVQSAAASQSRITFANIAMTGGPQPYGGNAPKTAVNRVGLTWNGKAVPDVIGWR